MSRGFIKGSLGCFGAIVLFLVVISIAFRGSGSADTSSKPSSAPSAPPAKFELIVSQSSCQESPSTAYVNCSIGVKNLGGEAGLPTVWVDYRYSDGSSTIDSSEGGTSDPIPAKTLGWVYFSHSYDATKHDLLQAAASLNVNANKYPYVRVADPSDNNWPTG